MKCKDIPDRPILEFVAWVRAMGQGAHWYAPQEIDDSGYLTSVRNAMPGGAALPRNLVLAKMRQLLRRKLLDGCGCGCGGWFNITEKGAAMITPPAAGPPAS